MAILQLGALGSCFRGRRPQNGKRRGSVGRVKARNVGVEESTDPIIRIPEKPKYNHASTCRSPEMLINLPTEILDEILGHLNEEQLRSVCTANRVFRASAQSLLFQRIELVDFRKSEEKPCKTERFIHLIEKEPRMRGYVQVVKIGSVIDPTVWSYVEELLPQVLKLLTPKELVIGFREIENVTHKTQRECTMMLSKM